MADSSRKNQDLIQENTLLRQRIRELERSESERYQEGEILREREDKFHQLAETAYDSIVVMDLDGVIRYANRSARDRAGFLNLIGLPMHDLLPPDQVKRHEELLQRRRGGDEKVYSLTWDLFSSNHTKRMIFEARSLLLKENGKPSGVLIIGRVVTDQKNLEEEFRESEEQKRLFLAHSLTGVFQTTIDGRILYMNDINLRMLGYESPPNKESILVPSLYRARSKRETMIRKLKKHKRLEGYELEITTMTGQVVTHLVNISLDGNILTGAAMDITDRKRMEQEFKAKSSSLEEANTALKVLLQQGQRGIEEVQSIFVSNVQYLIKPYLKKFHSTPLNEDQRTLLTTIEANMDAVLSPFVIKLLNAHAGFTHTEIKVANFMKRDNTVKEIAGILNVSTSAVNFHRQNIKKKLGISGKKINLRRYLQSFSE